MAQGNIDIAVRIKGAKEAQADAKRVASSIDGVDRSAEKANKSQGSAAGAAGLLGRGFKGAAMGAAGAIGAYIGVDTAVTVMKDSLDESSRAAESLSKNQVLFGKKNAKITQAFAKNSADTYGISNAAALEYTGTFGALIKASGKGGKAAAKGGVGFTKLAADMASFSNTSIDDAMEALRSGLVGEAEPLRRYGVLLDDAKLRQRALKMGIISSTKQALTPQQKSLAAQAEIFAQTKDAQGDAIRTGDQYAGSMKRLNAQFKDVEKQLGDALKPVMLAVATELLKFFKELKKGEKSNSGFVKFLRDIWSGTKAVATAVGWTIRTFKSLYKNSGLVRTAVKIAMFANPVYRFVQVIKFAVKAFNWLKDAAINTKNWIVAAFRNVIRFFGGLGKSIGSAASGAFNGLKSGATSAKNWIVNAFNNVLAFFKRLPGRIGRSVSGAFNGLKSAFASAGRFIQDKWNALELTLSGPKGIGRITIGTPDIHVFRAGGRVPGRRVAGDTVPAMLSPGEFVVTSSGERMLEGLTGIPGVLNRVGASQRQHFNSGGRVSPVPAMAGAGTGRPIITKVYLDRRQIAEAVGSEFADRQARR